MKRDEKGQFKKESEHIETIEEKIKSFSLDSKDSKDYFGIGKNFSDYLSVSELKEEKSKLFQHINIMRDFKGYLSFLAAKKIRILEGNYTMQCRGYPDHVTFNILDITNHGKENLELLGLQSDFEALSHTEKLTLIIDSLQRIIKAIDCRISYLQSPA